MSDDEKISRRYRELLREEPPRHLDDAIRAAARRAVQTRPAPLVVPTGRQRWYFPLAAAAIIVLAVAVTMHVEREQPGEEIVTAPPAPAGAPSAPQELMREAPPEKPKPAPEFRKAPEPSPAAPAASAPSTSQDAANTVQQSASGALRDRVETAPRPVPVPAGAPEAKAVPPVAQTAPARVQRADEAARQSSQLAKLAERSPEQWLQGIADLRRQGRHEEADKALAEFRKRHPDYKIPEAMLEKVEKR